MNARIVAIVAVAVLAALAACGKIGEPQRPPGGFYQAVYPSTNLDPMKATAEYQGTSVVAPITSSAIGMTPPPNPTGPAFAPDGAWIDPAVRRVTIDPYADRAPLPSYGGVPGPGSATLKP